MSKKRFIVCYDYGSGGVWGFVLARSKEEIFDKYPELTVIDAIPAWMTNDYMGGPMKSRMFDIDDIDRPAWLASA